MTRKALNRKNLLDLGAETLADLLLDAVKGDAARQRQVRMALAADQGAQAAASDMRKRFASLRRARSFLSGQAQRRLAKELAAMTAVIETQIAPEAPDTAFDLLWSLLQLAPGLHERTDDSNGTIGGVMDDAMEAIERLAPRLSQDPVALADTVFDALQDNGYGEYDGAVPALAAALTETGLEHLKTRATEASKAPLTEADLARYDFIPDAGRRAELARDSRDRSAKMILQDVADLQGDVDSWLARYTAEQLTFHTIAPDAAARLLAAGRADEALRLIETAMASERQEKRWFDTPEMDAAHFACLAALGRDDDLRAALWARFERWLCADALRRYLRVLPDFEDEEALHLARSRVLAFPSVVTALEFCLTWPDPALAAKLVLSRSGDLDGNTYEILAPAAEALAPEHPLAAVLLWRAMIDFALDHARVKRYGHAARHLGACAAVDAAIPDYQGHPDHAAYLRSLREGHGRKQAFWNRVGTG